MRKRFNRACICSSENYEKSKKAHREFLFEKHNKNITEITEIVTTFKITKRYYVKCFGKLIEVTEREALMLGSELIIIK